MDCFSRDKRFHDLCKGVMSCDLCDRMRGRTKVLSHENGNINSKVLFIAEAPGRLGADKTKIPLYGDKAGENFELLLKNIKWQRGHVFITNAVLCNPRCDNGNNAPPTDLELENCSHNLLATIECIAPQVIVTLGGVALRALNLLQKHDYSLKRHVRKLLPWNKMALFIAYHPGQRALLHRSIDNQRADFYELSRLVDPIRGLKKKRRYSLNITEKERSQYERLMKSVVFIIKRMHRMTKFKLVKLMYMADLLSIKLYGVGITDSVYLRQADGPWPPAINKALKYLDRFEITQNYNRRIPFIFEGPYTRIEDDLDERSSKVLLEIIEKYGHLNNAQIKTIAYKTPPMQDILKKERAGASLKNSVVLDARLPPS